MSGPPTSATTPDVGTATLRALTDLTTAIDAVSRRIERIERDVAVIRDVALAARSSEGWPWLPTRRGGR